MLVYQVSQHTPLYWPYMFYFTTAVRGLPASDFGLLKSIYYFAVMAGEVPLGVVADRLGRRWTLVLAGFANSLGCAFYVFGRGFAVYAAGELCFATGTALQSGADTALLYDAFAADGRAHEFARAQGAIEAVGLAAGAVAFSLAGLLVTADGDPTPAYAASALTPLAGAAAAFLLVEPPRSHQQRLRAHVAQALRDLAQTPGLIATLAFSALVYLGLRAANALVWNPVLAAAGVPLRALGALTAAVTLLAAWTAWRAHAWRDRVGEPALTLGLALSLTAIYLALPFAHGALAAALLVSHGFALGVVPVVIADLLNRRIASSERRATLLSFESLAQRGSYGVVVIFASAALEHRSLAAVLLGFAATSAAAAALVPFITRRSDAQAR